MNDSSRAPISDADFNAVRALAAQGRPIPAIVMAAIVERLEAKATEAEVDAPDAPQLQAV
ncbi:hypothetical protein E2493_03085 [Sphingomonas parva]|uniref:Uncharacterized protein n=1 Tax=Sphingomonas parva TaxID=2555898 RepID=A0A4Y8ZWS8_9SPHN|nr:hypothetical protein [Sphingomonas parva]TFI59832.1 hypothetical protein E2493_03085 [Sphingomonas parva]